MKKNFLALGILILVLVLLYFVACALRSDYALQNTASPRLESANPQAQLYTYATTTISTPNGNIVVQIADTPDKQTQGLSDRTSLPQGKGIIFVFDTPAPQYMWMKDMNFALDIVWLDQNKKVVHIAADATAESYREILLSFFLHQQTLPMSSSFPSAMPLVLV